MINLKVKKGYDLNISGIPSPKVETRDVPDRVAVLPEHIPFVKARLRIKEGDSVTTGMPLFEDKRNPEMVYLSPGGGVIESINYGYRRVVKEIVIKLDPDEKRETFTVCDPESLKSSSREEVVGLLVKGGLWPLIRELPFRDIADPEFIPKILIVTLDSKEKFLPSPAVYLKDNESLFKFGIDILRKLSGDIWITSAGKVHELPGDIPSMITHRISGGYPSHDPGVVLYHCKQSSEENRAWFVDGQDVLLIAKLFSEGSYPVEKIYSVGGEVAGARSHIKARIGSPVTLFDSGGGTASFRYVAGGVLNGYRVPETSFIGFYESSLTLLPEGDEEEFFGFIRPGLKKHSFSRTFLSVFNRSPLPMTCNMHGELRACINCGTCEKVCPVDILPQFTLKCIVAGEVEEALEHGLLDCVECGLCTYVCPSKIELNHIMITAKADYYKERA